MIKLIIHRLSLGYMARKKRGIGKILGAIAGSPYERLLKQVDKLVETSVNERMLAKNLEKLVSITAENYDEEKIDDEEHDLIIEAIEEEELSSVATTMTVEAPALEVIEDNDEDYETTESESISVVATTTRISESELGGSIVETLDESILSSESPKKIDDVEEEASSFQ